uniref:NADH dehydrogenase subunit 6 n=2 Tax=Cheumatopsyche TaxID=177865 RepID=A0A3G1NDD9_9NEOP|nr:NADH dehydrogenase subunit 6 [Cheumatopsyche campyla]YP_009459944.1 NADH dehydrogenase subunit 6 [Cheumatopsyche analis]AUT18196.1 NADH dehydrogenase subunit 6 [Cheumatopsyche campyla]AUT18209.1 NADH dehydrogenase subunit 6 [Cheumatopsyche analis]
MKFILMNLTFLISLILMIIKTPLNMGMLILFQTLIFSMILNINSNIYWMSYILYLIMLGGILILFIYMCSITSNEIFKFNINFMILSFILYIYLLMMSYYKNFFWLNFMISKLNLNFFINKEIIMNVSKIYNNFTMMITIILIIYLLISLLMVAMFTNMMYGPLRAIK